MFYTSCAIDALHLHVNGFLNLIIILIIIILPYYFQICQSTQQVCFVKLSDLVITDFFLSTVKTLRHYDALVSG